MKDKQPSPQDKTKVRIDKGKREIQRLTKEAQKHLVEGHSPAIYDYIDNQLGRIEDPVRTSTATIGNGIMSSSSDMEHYFTDAEKAIMESADIWGAEYQKALKDAEERNFGWVSDLETRQLQYIFRGEDTIKTELKDDEEEVKDNINRAEDEDRSWMEFQINMLKGLIDDAKVNGADENIGWMDAIGAVPGIIVGIGSLLNGFVNLDPEKYIEDNLLLAKTQKRLQERIKSEGD